MSRSPAGSGAVIDRRLAVHCQPALAARGIKALPSSRPIEEPVPSVMLKSIPPVALDPKAYTALSPS